MTYKEPYQLNLTQWQTVLRRCLERKLPGTDAQLLMAPAYRRESILKMNQPVDAISSAVLIALYQKEDEVFIPFIKRAEYNGVHSSQVSFPGGKAEPEDMGSAQTAMREAHEEIGLDITNIAMIGSLTPLYIPPSNFIVYPYLSVIAPAPIFTIDPVEVQSVIEIPLQFLLKNDARQEKIIEFRDGGQYPVPGYWYEGHFIWGATAMILSEFIEMIRQELENPLQKSSGK